MAVSPPRLLLPPVSTAGPGTLYQQVVASLKRAIADGRLPPGAPLPSFRGLAQDLLVSVITVKRAYEELEQDGIIYRRQGLGTFVAEAASDRNRAATRQHAEALLRDALRAATDAGLPPKELVRLLQSLIQEQGEKTHASARH